MDRPKYKLLCKILIVFNTIAVFFAVGMPKLYTNESHFATTILPHFTRMYTTRNEMVLQGDNGKDVTVAAGTRIGVYDIPDTDLYAMTYPDSRTVTVTEEDLLDSEKFEDTTEQMKSEWQEHYTIGHEKGQQEFLEYMFRQRIWFLLPHRYLANFIVGIVAALISLLVMINFYRHERYLPLSAALFVLIILKICVIVYFYVDPVFCL